LCVAKEWELVSFGCMLRRRLDAIILAKYGCN
jgi:hypothetical protein